MGTRKYPPRTPSEVISILQSLGFSFKRQTGSHQHFERVSGKNGKRCIVTVDTSIGEFWEELIKSMIGQSGFSREQFYGATKRTFKKIR
jgi:predicted RNA binding protein YcfA (HicA-like mRNA interferase family)